MDHTDDGFDVSDEVTPSPVAEMAADLAAALARTADTEDKYLTVKADLEVAEAAIAELRGLLDQAEAAAGAATVRAETAETAAEAANSTLALLRTAMDEATTQAAVVFAKQAVQLDEAVARADTAATQIIALQQEITELRAGNATLQANAEEDRTEAQRRADAARAVHETELDAAYAAVAAQEALVARHLGMISTLRAELAAAIAQHDTLRADLAATSPWYVDVQPKGAGPRARKRFIVAAKDATRAMAKAAAHAAGGEVLAVSANTEQTIVYDV